MCRSRHHDDFWSAAIRISAGREAEHARQQQNADRKATGSYRVKREQTIDGREQPQIPVTMYRVLFDEPSEEQVTDVVLTEEHLPAWIEHADRRSQMPGHDVGRLEAE